MNTDERVLPPEVNLVHYDNPELVINIHMETIINKDNCVDKMELSAEGDSAIEGLCCNEVLKMILPPKEWTKDGKTWRQKLSNKPSTKMEVKKLGEKLDTYLEQYKAREVGICPIKRELYDQCFNEIIRQVTLNCTERGYLLTLIRDELKLTINSYQELFESTIAYGIRRTLLREHEKSELETTADRLKKENEMLENELANKIKMTKELEQEMTEARENETKRHAEELNALKKANFVIKAQLESIIAPKKAS